MAKETLASWSASNPGKDASVFDHNKGLHIGNKIKTAQHDAWTKGMKARAIVQKYTGKDHRIGTYDWFGGTGKSNERHSWKRRRDAYQELRHMQVKKRMDAADHSRLISGVTTDHGSQGRRLDAKYNHARIRRMGSEWLKSRKFKPHLSKGSL
jgi:hypothetical protein